MTPGPDATPQKSLTRRDVAALLLAVVSIALGVGVYASGSVVKVFVHGAYYLVLATVAVWLYLVFGRAELRWRNLARVLKRHAAACLCAVVVTVVVCRSVDSFYRVLSDETNLVSVSQAFTFRKAVHNTTSAEWYYENFHPTAVAVEKRPLLFPFVLSLVHSLVGYDYRNAFHLNNALLAVFLLTVYAFAAPIAGRRVGIAAMLFTASQPIVAMAATSAGFDLLNAVLFFYLLITIRTVMHRPDARNLAIVWATLWIYAHVRYENAIYLVLVPAALAACGRLPRAELRRCALFLGAAPLLALPRVLQATISSGQYENPPGVPLFSLGHFAEHLQELAGAIGKFDFFLPYNPLLNVLGALGAVAMAVAAIRGRRVDDKRRAGAVAFVTIAAGTVIFLAHHMGKFTHPTQARFFLVLVTGFSIAATLWVRTLFRGRLNFLVALGVIMIAIYLPVASEGRFSNSLTVIRQTRQIYDYFGPHPDRRVLVVSDLPNHFTVLEMGAMTHGQFRVDKEKVLEQLRHRLIQDVYFVQKVDLETGKVQADDDPGAGVPVEAVLEFQNTPTEIVRLARLVRPAIAAN